MRTPSCPREADVLDLVWTGQWPARADRPLVEHVRECAVCRELAAVAAAMGDLHEATAAEIKVPDAAAVWYRAQVRARQDLARRAARPVAAAQAAAAALGLDGAFTAWRVSGAALAGWWRDFSAYALPDFAVPSGLATLTGTTAGPWLLAGLAAWILMVPAALYVARLVDRTSDR